MRKLLGSVAWSVALAGCASSGGGADRVDPGEVLVVEGQAWAFEGRIASTGISRGQTIRGTTLPSGGGAIFVQGEVRFLPDSWALVEYDRKPCGTRPVRYHTRGTEVIVACGGTSLVLRLAEGQVVGTIHGIVEVEATRRACDHYESINGARRCTQWGEVPVMGTVEARGPAKLTRLPR